MNQSKENIIPRKHWLKPFPWKEVVALNLKACKTGKVEHRVKEKAAIKARILWDKSILQEQTLRSALDVCRACHQIGPFEFFNGNTFAFIARSMILDISHFLNSTKLHTFRSCVGHYVAGTLKPEEFDNAYQSIETTVAKFK